MSLWEVLLKLKRNIKQISSDCELVSVKIDKDVCQIEPDQVLKNATFNINFGKSVTSTPDTIDSKPLEVKVKNTTRLNQDEIDFLELYLPYALLPFYARKENRCMAISHFAQTLDGRIASTSGDSKWIGNEENLIHAHRMRALCDGILIGSNTLQIDDPRLNVRLVKGNNPVKIIIGGDSLQMKDYKLWDEEIIRFCRQEEKSVSEKGKLVTDKETCFNTSYILDCLYKKGIHSVYIEGGAYTTSSFLKEKSLDQVQLHFSSKILGSGTNSISFQGVHSMEEAFNFKHSRFVRMGNEMMFIGNL